MAQVVIDIEKCNGCGHCVNGCGQGSLALDSAGKAEVVKPSDCVFCWECVYNCPVGAVAID